MCSLDKYSPGTLWLCIGDDANAGGFVSEDWGVSWRELDDDNASLQPVTILPMRDGILWGSDNPPNGIYRTLRDDPDKKITPILIYDQKTALSVISRFFTQRGDNPAYLTFMGTEGSGAAGNLRSQGLVDFQRMWRIRLVLDQNETMSSGAPALT
jgi:hypothetical protein